MIRIFFIDNFYLRNGIIVGEQLRFAEVTVENVNIAEFIHAIEKREETSGPLLGDRGRFVQREPTANQRD